MKQILQNLGNGETILVDAPVPASKSHHLLINTSCSLISLGTERMLVEFGRANLLQKARQQPEKVKMVIDKVKTDGLATTLDAVKSKLDQPLPLGYCNVGVVGEVGNGVEAFHVGDRVVSNGPHADVVVVGKHLCAVIPDPVTDEEAVFTVLGAIGLQGVRLINPTLGESVVVIGAGLIGLMTVQLLLAQGCRVLAVDFDPAKLKLAEMFGAQTCNPAQGEDPVQAGLLFSRGAGVDAVIITASSKSSEPVSQAARMSRKRGRIVLVGVVGLEFNRSEFYEKELSFQVSCSYGPGRYDTEYEENGRDYPLGFVRWTEQRNFVAILDLMAAGRINVRPLITHRFAFQDAIEAYDTLAQDRSAMGIVLRYETDIEKRHIKTISLKTEMPVAADAVVLGLLGAGNYASRVLVPALKETGADFHTVCSAGGVNGVILGEKQGFRFVTTETGAVFADQSINTVVIATRHNSHADLVIKALEAGKQVFVEKPLALTTEEIDRIDMAYRQVAGKSRLMVGFNRRYSPHVQKIKSLLQGVTVPKSFIMTMNAGAIPANHWTQDVNVGGGRIIGEACHYVDLMRYLAGSRIVSVQSRCMGAVAGLEVVEDKACILLGFEDGSFGTIIYLANGHSSFPKERIEVFAEGRVLHLDNFRKLTGYGWPSFKRLSTWRQEKGQKECALQFVESIRQGAAAPIPYDEIIEVARVSVEVSNQLRQQ